MFIFFVQVYKSSPFHTAVSDRLETRYHERMYTSGSRRGFVTLPLLAVIVVAGVLTGLAMESPPDPRSQLAEAGGGLGVDKSSPTSCTAAIQKAYDRQGDNDGVATSVAQKESEVLVSCFGAALVNKSVPVGKRKTSDYKCVGRSAKVTITSEKVTAVSEADESAPKGKCLKTAVNGKPTAEPSGSESGTPTFEDLDKKLTDTRKDISDLEAKQNDAIHGQGTPLTQAE